MADYQAYSFRLIFGPQCVSRDKYMYMSQFPVSELAICGMAIRGVARILVWGGGINFRNLMFMAVISLSHHDIPPPRVARA